MSLPSEVNPHLLASGSSIPSNAISRSVRTRRSASGSFSRTPASASNRRTWTWSGWVKRGAVSVSDTGGVIGIFGAGTLGTGIANFQCYWNSDSTLYFQETVQNSSNQLLWTSTPVYRDPTAWYHIVVAVDVTQATASNRLKLYVNGVAQSGSFSVTPGTTTDLSINNNVAQYIGGAPINPNVYGNILTYHDGYFAEVNFVDGQQLTPTSFGAFDATTGVWNPTAYTGSYGTNGYYLKFSDNSAATAAAIGKDSSGNGNNWTPTNISVTAGATNDSLLDSPTNYGTDTGVGGTVRGNYATLNPLANGTAAYLKNGNLRINPSDGNFQPSFSTIGVSSGKWYAECTVTNVGTGFVVGIDKLPSTLVATQSVGQTSTSWGWYGDGTNNRLYNNNSYVTTYGTAYTTGVVIGIALDMDAGTLVFYRNGVSQGTAATGLSGTYAIGASPAGAAGIADMNYGQRPFANTAPSGFKALCTQNLPAVSILNPNKHFDVLTTTATNSTGMTLSGLQFEPYFFWRKNRNNAEAHYLFDRVRGSTSFLSSSTAGAEAGYPSADGSVTFNSDGYTIADSNWNNGEFYFNGRTYVDFFWKGGGTAVTNTSGTISSQVSANPTAGFSILTYTGNGTVGATVGHGLGATPGMVIVKSRSATADWPVKILPYMAGGARLELDTTNAITTESAGSGSLWNATNPNSTVITLGNQAMTNTNGTTYVAYCFAPISGYSAFGSYIGNGSTDGPFVYLGFRPRWLLIKRSDSTGSWYIWDTSRSTYNQMTLALYPNLADAEPGGDDIDFLSNGFKMRDTFSYLNASGGTFLYAAFAENPFKYSRAR